MTETTPRHGLPLLEAGQAQKELWHNEALALIDMIIAPVVQAIGIDTPPAGAVPGECWIVGPSPTGDWAGAAGNLAGRTAGGWRFVAPRDGMSVRNLADGTVRTLSSESWQERAISAPALIVAGNQVVGPQTAAIAVPSGGTVVDVQARAAISLILNALSSHGLIAA